VHGDTETSVNFLFKNSYIIQFVASISESLVKNTGKKKVTFSSLSTLMACDNSNNSNIIQKSIGRGK